MKEFWNARYNAESYAYGKNPNQYFKDQIDLLPPGKILLAAEGEGRNPKVPRGAEGLQRAITDHSASSSDSEYSRAERGSASV